MSFESHLNFISQRAANAPALGKKLKFDIDGQSIMIDGTGSENCVSQDNAEADCTIRISDENLSKLISGDLNPMMAFMMGKVKVDGDMSVAMQLQSLIA